MFSLFQRRRSLPDGLSGRAICYSGYRDGQSPLTGQYPSHAQVKEDLELLAGHWQFLRLYDCGPHARIVLEVIRRDNLPFRVMMGMGLSAEVSNPDCPWGGEYPDAVLAAYRRANEAELGRMIRLCRKYRREIFAASIGNEAAVSWNDHMVPVDRLIRYARALRRKIPQPVTFCENYVPWRDKIKPLAEHLDIVSVHTYPVWEYKTIDAALEYTRENYYSVRHHYPDKPVIITEAGWTCASNGRGIDPDNASEALQAEYCRQLLDWADGEHILTFLFEAFDEPWKGSEDPMEPEKHWGLYREDRSPKPVVSAIAALDSE